MRVQEQQQYQLQQQGRLDLERYKMQEQQQRLLDAERREMEERDRGRERYFREMGGHGVQGRGLGGGYEERR